MKVINLMNEVNSVEGLYLYKKIASMNGNMLSVVQVENRTLDMHVHENSDEIFCVLEGEFDLVMDFLYCSNIRRILGFKSLKLENLSQIVLKIALKKLVEYCCANEIYLKTYKIQKYDGLTCLNESEYSIGNFYSLEQFL